MRVGTAVSVGLSRTDVRGVGDRRRVLTDSLLFGDGCADLAKEREGVLGTQAERSAISAQPIPAKQQAPGWFLEGEEADAPHVPVRKASGENTTVFDQRDVSVS